jgi:hypothetical protein
MHVANLDNGCQTVATAGRQAAVSGEWTLNRQSEWKVMDIVTGRPTEDEEASH